MIRNKRCGAEFPEGDADPYRRTDGDINESKKKYLVLRTGSGVKGASSFSNQFPPVFGSEILLRNLRKRTSVKKNMVRKRR